MASLYWSPAIVYGATTFWLPPWITVSVSRGQTIDFQSVPQTNSAIISSVRPNQGAKISLAASGIKPGLLTQETILAWFEEIWSNCSGEDKTFDLFIFNDRAWRDCALESQSENIGLEPLIALQDMQLNIICPFAEPSTDAQLTFSDYDTEYPYASIVGRPLGLAATPGSEVEIMHSVQTLSATFQGPMAETSAGDEHAIIVGGAAGSQWSLKQFQITHADNSDADGTTTVRISTAAVGGSGSQLNATVAQASHYGAAASGSITVDAGDILYVYIPSSGFGKHQNIECMAVLHAL